MADTKISALTAGSALGGTEVIPGVQSAANVKITAQQIKDYIAGYVDVGGPALQYPNFTPYQLMIGNGTLAGLTALTSSGVGAAVIGRLYINGKSTSKTISSAGGKIHLLAGTTTFSNAGTTLRVGLMDVSSASGPGAIPDDTFDVYDDLVGGTDTISGWTTVNMSTGTKTLAHGDMVAIAWKTTSYGGADSIVFQRLTFADGAVHSLPCTATFSASTWSTTPTYAACAVIEFDDGTLGTLYGVAPITAIASNAFSDSTNPDERGNVFQLPFNARVSGINVRLISNLAGSDFTATLYSTPTGTPSSLASVSVPAEQTAGRTTIDWLYIPFPTEVTLTKNTQYCVALKATGASNISMNAATVANANYKNLFITGGANVSSATRNNSTGAFTTTSTEVYLINVEISQIYSA